MEKLPNFLPLCLKNLNKNGSQCNAKKRNKENKIIFPPQSLFCFVFFKYKFYVAFSVSQENIFVPML